MPVEQEAKPKWEQKFNEDHAQPEESKPEPEPEAQPEVEEAEPEQEVEQPEGGQEKEPEPEQSEEGEEEPEAEEQPEGEEGKEKAKEEPKPAGDVEDDKIREYAIQNGLTFHDAKTEFEKAKAVVDKYKGDPLEMARALRSQQAEYDKLRTSTEKDKAEAGKYAVSENPALEVQQWVGQNKEKLVEAFKAKYPAQAADMSDEAIVERVTETTLTNFKQWNEQQKSKIAEAGKARRDELLKSLPEADKRFLPDIKVVLDKTPERMLLSKEFDFQHIIYWAKGQYYDKDIKAAEERATKRANEQPKIVGAIKQPQGGGKKPSGAPATSSLSTWDKQRAREMYPSTMTDEECYKAYTELKTRKQKKKE